ncbi:hypothetical protein QTI17_17255 [Variovorax sp. J31P179]|uniref:hypothetical protein n=1 Tax=Variovorax sp. J31P179 TaxID=3053508 RepID=UPI0025776750|nr:hypothetical protein [Variovorax sp. J31P179]MDM0082343.1 hypothetical protein [Variovorax sp. J31P179]
MPAPRSLDQISYDEALILALRAHKASLPNPDASARAVLSAPGLLQRYAEEITSGRMSMDQAVSQAVELRQFRRARNHDRVVQGEYNGDPTQPLIPLPFAARETHRPDRLPGTPTYEAMVAATDQIEADTITRDLIAQMAGEPSTWERTSPDGKVTIPADQYVRPAEPPSAPTLRDTVQASYEALSSRDGMGGERMD